MLKRINWGEGTRLTKAKIYLLSVWLQIDTTWVMQQGKTVLVFFMIRSSNVSDKDTRLHTVLKK